MGKQQFYNCVLDCFGGYIEKPIFHHFCFSPFENCGFGAPRNSELRSAGCAGHFDLLLGGKAGLEDSDLQALELDRQSRCFYSQADRYTREGKASKI